MGRHTTHSLAEKKRQHTPIVALTAYDYPLAIAADQAGVDWILVGDSLGPVVLGYANTLPVTLDEMVHHAAAVVRGTARALVVADMPFMADLDVPHALASAARLFKEAGVQAIKLEGGKPAQCALVRALVERGIPVVGHVGFTPQHLHQLGGARIQGKTTEAADALLAQARALEEAGAFMVVLELVPDALAARITGALGVPTIGIGAGGACDGQIQVMHDLVGLHVDHRPRHARRYAEAHEVISQAIAAYATDVRNRQFAAGEPGYVETLFDSQEGIG